MVLAMDTGERCELRHNYEWVIGQTDTLYQAHIKLVPNPADRPGSFTFMQIGADIPAEYEQGPVLMISWRSSFQDESNHLWARTRDLVVGPKTLEYFDLGPLPEGCFDLTVLVKNRIVFVWINGHLKVDYPWDHLNALNANFRTGVYLHPPGLDMQPIYFD